MIRIGIAALALASAAAVVVPASASAGVEYVSSCTDFGDSGADSAVNGPVWQGSGSGSIAAANRCPQGGSFEIISINSAGNLASAKWETTAPGSIQIVQAYTRTTSVLVNKSLAADGYRAIFFWDGGRQDITPGKYCCGQEDYGTPISASIGPSRHFGFGVYCARSSCPSVTGALLDVHGVDLEGVDGAAPAIAAQGANNIWYQAGRWIRGAWPAPFGASADAGICATAEVVDGRLIAGPSFARNGHTWTQCPAAVPMNQTIDTSSYANGPLSLSLGAADATSPANRASATHTLAVDNSPVTASLSGPADAPSSAGTQYVSASALAGPSGVRGFACSLDGGAFQAYPPPSARIPVAGIGRHEVLCYASNNAVDVSGRYGTSMAASWSLTIREPTAIAATFAHVTLRCSRHTKRVYVPGRLVKVHRHHKVLYIHRRGHHRRVSVLRCRALVLDTHPYKRVGFGRPTTVSGWLRASDGTALSGQTVRVMSAPDNGSGQFAQSASATTGADGGWSATLPAGPSRLVEAAYAGSGTAEPSISAPIHIVVPASVKLLKVFPRHVGWGGTVHIVGQLRGGYLPATGALVRLRIGLGSARSTFGVEEHVSGSGRFATTYTFGPGSGSRRYWFSLASLPVGDYPYAPSSSGRRYVTVG